MKSQSYSLTYMYYLPGCKPRTSSVVLVEVVLLMATGELDVLSTVTMYCTRTPFGFTGAIQDSVMYSSYN